MNVYSFFVDGVTPEWVEVEYHSRFQIPGFQILGLPGPEIQEARERVAAAFQNSDFEFPKRKVIVNLTPSSLRKSGTGHDLGIAIKIFYENSDQKKPRSILAWGELGLDGSIKPAGKIAHLIELLMRSKINSPPEVLYLSVEDANLYQALIDWRITQKLPIPQALKVRALTCLRDVLNENEITQPNLNKRFFETKNVPSPPNLLPLSPEQERVIQIAILGRHHTLLMGPKGVGKSAALEWFKALIPESEALETWDRILKQEGRKEVFQWGAPIRRVSSDVKPAHLLGFWGNHGYQAGELAMAHGGILFADEFVEWARDSKECLREPLQSKRIHLTRTRGTLQTDCDLQLVATGNLCRCGGLPKIFRTLNTTRTQSCRCSENQVKEYLEKLSGPIIDRLDLVILITANADLSIHQPNHVLKLQKNIAKAREFSQKHFGTLPSRLDPMWLEEQLPDDPKIKTILESLPSLRSRHKTLRVARAIQALENSLEFKPEHVFEAKSYRLFDRL